MLTCTTTALAFAPHRNTPPTRRVQPLPKWNLASAVADEPARTSTTADEDIGACGEVDPSRIMDRSVSAAATDSDKKSGKTGLKEP